MIRENNLCTQALRKEDKKLMKLQRISYQLKPTHSHIKCTIHKNGKMIIEYGVGSCYDIKTGVRLRYRLKERKNTKIQWNTIIRKKERKIEAKKKEPCKSGR